MNDKIKDIYSKIPTGVKLKDKDLELLKLFTFESEVFASTESEELPTRKEFSYRLGDAHITLHIENEIVVRKFMEIDQSDYTDALLIAGACVGYALIILLLCL